MVSEQYKTFLISYRHDGAEWSLELPARDLDDARARLSRLAFASIDGELMMTLPASSGPIAPLFVAIRNSLHRLLNPRT